MALISNSKLFPNSTKAARARENAQQATELLRQMSFALQNPHSRTAEQLQGQARRLASALRGTGGMIPVESQLIRMAESVERLAREHQQSLVSQVLNALGTPGQLIQSWLRGRDGSQSLNPLKNEIQTAMNLLSQFAPTLTEQAVSPEDSGGQRRDDWSEPSTPANRQPPAPSRPRPSSSAGSGGSGGRLPPDNSGPHPNVQIMPDGQWRIRGPGYQRTLNPNDPILTGEMQRVQSSNVHSIGFEFNFDQPLKSKLIIRYLQKDRRGSSGTVGGPTYAYDNVHPDWFQDLREAGSKGKWVWDQLRIRGTVAGHQYPYNLIRAAQGYLPRRAIIREGMQKFVRRQRTAVYSDGRTEILTSALQNQNVGRYSPTAHRPNVGNMDRGRLERGAPNRGR